MQDMAVGVKKIRRVVELSSGIQELGGGRRRYRGKKSQGLDGHL